MSACGLLFAGISYARREDKRVAVAGGSVAMISLAWQVAMIALGVIALILIIGLFAGIFEGTSL